MECLSEMLAFWLKGTSATSTAMVQALVEVGMPLLAKKIAITHGKVNTYDIHTIFGLLLI